MGRVCPMMPPSCKMRSSTALDDVLLSNRSSVRPVLFVHRSICCHVPSALQAAMHLPARLPASVLASPAGCSTFRVAIAGKAPACCGQVLYLSMRPHSMITVPIQVLKTVSGCYISALPLLSPTRNWTSQRQSQRQPLADAQCHAPHGMAAGLGAKIAICLFSQKVSQPVGRIGPGVAVLSCPADLL